MSKHKALELAQRLKRLRLAREGNPETSGRMHEAEEIIRAQHALIVQMRDAMALADLSVVAFADAHAYDAAVIAADQYLGEQA